MPDDNSNFILVMSCSQEIIAAIKRSCQWLHHVLCVGGGECCFWIKKENQLISITWCACCGWKLRQYFNKNCEWKILNVSIFDIELNPLSANNQRMKAGNEDLLTPIVITWKFNDSVYTIWTVSRCNQKRKLHFLFVRKKKINLLQPKPQN